MNHPDLSMVRHLKAHGRHEEAYHLLTEWLIKDPENPRLIAEMAFVLDNMGREAEAIPYYQKVIAQLDRPIVEEVYIGLGSSLRVMGRVAESYAVLAAGRKKFPKNQALEVFLALSQFSQHNYGDAMRSVMNVLLHSTAGKWIEDYRPTLEFYRDHLGDTSPEKNPQP